MDRELVVDNTGDAGPIFWLLLLVSACLFLAFSHFLASRQMRRYQRNMFYKINGCAGQKEMAQLIIVSVYMQSHL